MLLAATATAAPLASVMAEPPAMAVRAAPPDGKEHSGSPGAGKQAGGKEAVPVLVPSEQNGDAEPQIDTSPDTNEREVGGPSSAADDDVTSMRGKWQSVVDMIRALSIARERIPYKMAGHVYVEQRPECKRSENPNYLSLERLVEGADKWREENPRLSERHITGETFSIIHNWMQACEEGQVIPGTKIAELTGHGPCKRELRLGTPLPSRVLDDSEEDWQEQSSKMVDFYLNSHLTISATFTSGPQESLLVRPPSKSIQFRTREHHGSELQCTIRPTSAHPGYGGGEKSGICNAPSWSWASIDGPIEGFYDFGNLSGSRDAYLSVSDECTPQGIDPFGQVRDGKLVVEGRMIRGNSHYVNYNASNSGTIHHFQAMVNCGTARVTFRPDYRLQDHGMPDGSEMHCLVLYEPAVHGTGVWCGLVLYREAPAAHESFQQVGMWRITSYSMAYEPLFRMFGDVEPEMVVII
ncbi:WD40 repeat-like protein [Apiospora phragmitis]|uniref:WD40 repeat-like protein n=1 Tax=Apiospora phragmitis TaxID=2905665 RepID=A0ABR1TAY4_9PEZI